MSVINKMLRDLDSRQAAGVSPAPARPSRTGVADGTLIVNAQAGRRGAAWRVATVMTIAAIVAGGALTVWWYLQQNALVLGKTAALPALAASVSQAPAMPVAQASVAAAPLREVKSGSAVPALMEPGKPIAKAASAAVPVAVKVPVADTPRLVPEQRAPERAAAPVLAAATPEVMPPRPGPSPAVEALAQAQSLWTAGSHEAAIDLLREALTVAERAVSAGTPAGSTSVLASLARELARMELAQGRVGVALEMLTRLEPALSGVAEVWALRGNAAQRLGRHQESAAAYLMALKLRPDEARWMLGAAVSLAVQGDTSAAAELAEKARAGGVLSPDVATYLRQLGVPVRER